MDFIQELENMIDDNVNLIIDGAKQRRKLDDADTGDEDVSGMKTAMLDCILLEKKLSNFQQAFNNLQSKNKANATGKRSENQEDELMEYFEALNADIEDDLTKHHKYQNLLKQLKSGSLQLAAASAEVVDEDMEHSMMITEEVNVPLDPITKKHVVHPVVNTICKHVYERDAIIQHIAKRRKQARCPVSGCVNDALLHPGILEEDAELKRLIERRKRGDESFFS